MKVKSESAVAQSCPTPSDPVDCSLPGPSIHGIFQARVLEWGAIDFSIYSHVFILKLKPHLQGTVFWHSSFISDESLGAPGISSKTEVLAKRQQIKRSKYSHQHFICLLTGSPVHLGLSNGNKDADEGMCIKRERCSYFIKFVWALPVRLLSNLLQNPTRPKKRRHLLFHRGMVNSIG